MNYGRPPSPPRNRYHPAAGRASASSFFTTSGYDPYAAPTRTSRDRVSGPRISDERIGAPRILPPRTRSPPRRAAVDDYAVALRPRPRRATLEPEAPRIRRPLSVITPSSPARSSRPVITSAIDRPPSPITKSRRDRRDDDYEVLPASSTSRQHHQRHSSLNIPDPGRLVPLDRGAREKAYLASKMGRPSVRERQGENDRDYGFEYTDAREPKLQDEAYRQRSRRDSYDTSRPKSMIVGDGYIPRSSRDPGPPISSRVFENIGRSESQRQGYRARDDDRAPKDYTRDDRDASSRKPPRPEITLHQPSNDGYTPPYPEEDSRQHGSRKPAPEEERLEPRTRPRKPASDEDRLDPRARDAHDDQYRSGDERPRRHRHKHHHRDPDRHREDDKRDGRERRVRDEPRDKRDRADDGGSSNGMLAGAGAATAGAGLAAEEIRRHRHREPRDDDREIRDEGYSRSTKRPQEHLREPERDHVDTSSVSTSLSISEREDREYQEARDAERHAKQQAELFVGPVEPILREQKSFERRPEDNTPRHHRSYRPRRHHSRTRDQDSFSESSSSSSSDSEDDRIPRQPRVVTPSNEDKPTPPPPKSILRKPREQFPEYPATVREGVAPHKDDKKKDVPPNARWTKIDRRLVNPEALGQDGVRFNEFVDHVIVLKVMDKEEIEKYTQKTADIREKRRMLTGAETQAPLPPPSDQSFDDPLNDGRGVRF